jgi:hypothetical protein
MLYCVIARIYYLLLDVGKGQLTKPSEWRSCAACDLEKQSTINQLALLCAAAFCALYPIYGVTEPVTAA